MRRCAVQRCFNSRAHVGRDVLVELVQMHPCSFNSRVHVGRDAASILKAKWNCRFNSRAHVGRDAEWRQFDNGEIVSIHAPTWGATCLISSQRPFCEVSIHAPTWGATCAPSLSACSLLFQFTRPRGARRAERDACGHCHVSIHAPTWGAT